MPRAFAALVLLRLSEYPEYRFAVSPSRALAATTIEILYQVGACEVAVEYVDRDLALSVQPRKFFGSLFWDGHRGGRLWRWQFVLSGEIAETHRQSACAVRVGAICGSTGHGTIRSSAAVIAQRSRAGCSFEVSSSCSAEMKPPEASFCRPRHFETRRFFARIKISPRTPRKTTFRPSST